MNIILAFDSFKSSISSKEAALAAKKGIKSVFKDAKISDFIIADGGEGTLEALSFGKKNIKYLKVKDALDRDIKAAYVLKGNFAVIEMAKASGIELLSRAELNPLKTSTYGVGQLIANVLKKGAKNIVVGLGGSATNDAGVGMLAALGYKFFDSKNREIVNFGGENLAVIKNVSNANILPQLKGAKFTILCDVNNPLCGKNGASYIFGPQKGSTKKDVKLLDSALNNFAKVSAKFLKIDKSKSKGAGAAGGLGYAFLEYLNADMKSGIEYILQKLRFEESLKNADYVITGEGCIDEQSFMGKAPAIIAKKAKKYNVDVIAIGGIIKQNAYKSKLGAIFSICDSVTSLEEALDKKNASLRMENLCKNLFKLIKTRFKNA